MKKSLKFLSALIICIVSAQVSNAQTNCDELFISEYIEGSGNNKAIEIYNPKSSAVDLTKYRLTRWQNGTSTWQSNYSDTLRGNLAANGVVVAILDRRNPNGTGVDTPASQALQGKADLFLSADYNRNFSMSFNGDDAVSLDKLVGNQWVPVDIFGKIGERPVTAWTDSFPYNAGIGLWLSANKTLIRKSNIKKGVVMNPAYFNAKSEWTVHGMNTFDSLGFHRCECNQFSASVADRQLFSWNVFPNPSNGKYLNVFSEADGQIQMSDLAGRAMPISVNKSTDNNYNHFSIGLNNIPAGHYLLQITLKDGRRAVQKVLIY